MDFYCEKCGDKVRALTSGMCHVCFNEIDKERRAIAAAQDAIPHALRIYTCESCGNEVPALISGLCKRCHDKKYCK